MRGCGNRAPHTCSTATVGGRWDLCDVKRVKEGTECVVTGRNSTAEGRAAPPPRMHNMHTVCVRMASTCGEDRAACAGMGHIVTRAVSCAEMCQSFVHNALHVCDIQPVKCVQRSVLYSHRGKRTPKNAVVTQKLPRCGTYQNP